MKYLLQDKKLTFAFRHSYVRCCNYVYDHYQVNGILSFAIMDLVFKIIRQQKRRRSIILKKRKPIIHLLNYVDIFNFDSNILDITFFSKNYHKTKLAYNLYLYRRKDFGYEASLEVIERENSCIIRFEDDFANRLQPKNVNLAAMVIHILEKEESDKIDVGSIIFYCVLLM